jgi:hypothetical protein
MGLFLLQVFLTALHFVLEFTFYATFINEEFPSVKLKVAQMEKYVLIKMLAEKLHGVASCNGGCQGCTA